MSKLFFNYNRYEILYLTFAFDSLLKFQVGGFRVHIGVLAILFLSFLDILLQPSRFHILKFFKRHWSILPFCCYLLLNALLNYSFPGVGITLFYYLVGFWVFYYFFLKESQIQFKAVLLFQWILVLSGLLQFFLVHMFEYQLAFFNPEHYQYEGDFVLRLRGFFLEPNWYSISLSFNTLLLLLKGGSKVIKYWVLIVLTMLCALFNGSYTFVGVLLLSLIVSFLYDLPRINIKRFSFVGLVLFGVLLMIVSRNFIKVDSSYRSDSIQTSFSYGSRLLPAIKTINFISYKSKIEQIFGLGVGSWPYVGLEQNQLGYIGSTVGEYIIKPAQRDSAEFPVFLLELGYLGIFLYLFDYIYLYLKYKNSSFILSVSAAFLFASFFLYPIFKFSMYLVPYYLVRSSVVNKLEKKSIF